MELQTTLFALFAVIVISVRNHYIRQIKGERSEFSLYWDMTKKMGHDLFEKWRANKWHTSQALCNRRKEGSLDNTTEKGKANDDVSDPRNN